MLFIFNKLLFPAPSKVGWYLFVVLADAGEIKTILILPRLKNWIEGLDVELLPILEA